MIDGIVDSRVRKHVSMVISTMHLKYRWWFELIIKTCQLNAVSTVVA